MPHEAALPLPSAVRIRLTETLLILRLLFFRWSGKSFLSSCYLASLWLCSAQGACKVFLIITTNEKEVT